MQLNSEMTALVCAVARAFRQVRKEYSCKGFSDLVEELCLPKPNQSSGVYPFAAWMLTRDSLLFDHHTTIEDFTWFEITDFNIKAQLFLSNHQEMRIEWELGAHRITHADIGFFFKNSDRYDVAKDEKIMELIGIIETVLDTVPVLKRGLDNAPGEEAAAARNFFLRLSGEEDKPLVAT